MGTLHSDNRSHKRRKAVRASGRVRAALSFERLEDRVLPSEFFHIDWVNRGDDGFDVFGDRAGAARRVVDAVLMALVARAMKGDPKVVALIESMRPPALSAESDDASGKHEDAVRRALDHLAREEAKRSEREA